MNRKIIKRVLTCKPLHFSEINYVINPWMKPGSINEKKTLSQWENLVNIYKKLGIKVEIIEDKADGPDMVFATDQSIVYGKKVLLSRFWHDERRSETPYYEKWFKTHGYDITYLPSGTYFEGNGDSYFWKDKLFIGTGFRADEFTCQIVSRLLDIEVIPLHITDAKFYHLDVGFLPLDSDTAFYYPKAFDKQSREVLKKLVPNLIEFSREEALGFCGNSVVTDHYVVHQKNNPSFNKKLKKLGYDSIEVDLSEFKKSGGGAHCLTNILE